MARLELDIPGLKAEVGNPFLKDGIATYPVVLQITSRWRLLWHALRENFEVRWYQWPKAVFLVTKWSATEWIKDKWPVRTSSEN